MSVKPKRLTVFTHEELVTAATEYAWPYEEEALAAGAAAGERGAYTRDELVVVEAFKVRGPRARTAVQNDPEYVMEVTRLALRARNGEPARDRLALESLTLLKGVRYRLASMLLHLASPRDPEAGYPPIDRLTVRALGLAPADGNFEDWDLYRRFSAECRALAAETGLDLRTVDRALMVLGGAA